MITTLEAGKRTANRRHLVDVISTAPTHPQRRPHVLYTPACRRATRLRQALTSTGDRDESGPEKRSAGTSSLQTPRLRPVLVRGCLGILLSAAHFAGAQPIDDVPPAETVSNRTPAAENVTAELWTAQAQDELGADLSLRETVSNRSPLIDTQVTFQVTVANAGPSAVQRVVVRDRLPSGYLYVSHQATRGTYTPSSGQWNDFAVGASGSVELTIVVTVKPSGNRVNVAEIVNSTSPDPDSTPGNGNAAEDDYAQATTTPRTANVPPIIIGQRVLRTAEAMPLTITLADVTVSDPDNAYPTEFTLSVQPGTGYTLIGVNQITPDPGFVGELTVPVTVNDGRDDSAAFDLLVQVSAAQGGPNIIVIMLDDLDERTLADLRNAGLMPNLQTALIDRGIEFSQSFVSTPLCCPSRTTFLTGQYAHNTGIVNNSLPFAEQGLEWAIANFDDSVTVATRLQALGYTTAHVGKYLNGYGSDPALASLAPAFDPHYVPPGWSHWRALVDQTTYCVYDYKVNVDGALTQYMRPPGQTESSATYETNVLADLAESFVLEHRDDAAPFYLEVMPLAPHAEHCRDAYGGQPPPDDPFEKRIRPAPEDATAAVPAFVPSPGYDEDLADKPSWLSGLPALTPADYSNIAEQYEGRLRAVLSTDRLIGRIVAALGTKIDDTVLIFTADNGWFYGEHRRSEKIYAYDEAARVPLYIAMPGSQAPTARSNLVLNNDLAPTILALASPGYADAQFDGRSLVPILRESTPPGWTDRAQFLIEYGRSSPDPQYYRYPTYSALRTQNTLYIESYGGMYYDPPRSVIGLELYDLSSDPNEMNSLLHYPENLRDAVLAPWLDLLATCAGGSCRQYEDAQGP